MKGAFFTGLKGKSRDEMRTEITNYLNAKPQVKNDIAAIRQPAADLRDRCDAPLPHMPMGRGSTARPPWSAA